jgi:rod shape-determining protein MreD
MSIYLVVPFLVASAVLQASIMPHLAVWGVFAELPLLLVATWGLLQGPREGFIWGFIAGIALDVLSGAPFGAATLSLMAVGLLSGLGKNSVFTAHFVFPMAVAFLATIVYDIVFMLIVWISGYSTAWLDSLFRIILPTALLNALLMPLIYGVMRLVHKRFGTEAMEW